jgi:hypothetical protein
MGLDGVTACEHQAEFGTSPESDCGELLMEAFHE